jgi:hypothetical protein
MVRKMFALQLGLAVAPLIGWGLGDLEGFASNPARLAVVAVAITSCSLVARQQTLGDPFAKGVHTPSGAQSALLVLGVMSVPIVLGGFAYADRRNLWVANDRVIVRSLGLLMYSVGEGVRIVALRALGYSYKSTDTPPAGGAVVEDMGWGLVIYHHDQDGKWRVARDAWGPDHPQAVK